MNICVNEAFDLPHICSGFNHKLTTFWPISQKTRHHILCQIVSPVNTIDICTGKQVKTTEEEHHLSSAGTGKVISVFWWMGTEVEQSKCFVFLLNKW